MRIPTITVLDSRARLNPDLGPKHSSDIAVVLNAPPEGGVWLAKDEGDGDWTDILDAGLSDDQHRLLSLIRRVIGTYQDQVAKHAEESDPVYKATVAIRSGTNVAFEATKVDDEGEGARIDFWHGTRKVASFQRAEVVGWLLLQD